LTVFILPNLFSAFIIGVGYGISKKPLTAGVNIAASYTLAKLLTPIAVERGLYADRTEFIRDAVRRLEI